MLPSSPVTKSHVSAASVLTTGFAGARDAHTHRHELVGRQVVKVGGGGATGRLCPLDKMFPGGGGLRFAATLPPC